jgi:hypothetical protein
MAPKNKPDPEPADEEVIRFNAHLLYSNNVTLRSASAELGLPRPSELLNLMLEAHRMRSAQGETDPFLEEALTRYRQRKVDRREAARLARKS